MATSQVTQIPSLKGFYTASSQIGSKDKSVEWYVKEFDGTPDETRELLENYAYIPSNEVDTHVFAIREKAWDIFPWPCIGKFSFLKLSLHKQPSYASILERLKTGAKYLDLGFCLGQDIRKLVADGAPSQNIYGVELNGLFIDLGYDLFRDRETLKAQLVQGSALDFADDSPLGKLAGKMDFIHLGLILHVFGLENQRAVLGNCLKVLKPGPGTLILGQAVGDVEGVQTPTGEFLHNDVTFKELWNDISERTGLKFDCRVTLYEGLWITEEGRKSGRSRRLAFEVEILGPK
ncbi:hypothetical protein F5B19DRAFT_498322 [Rostrohypoxylon terebratum]|nr:hypothetical protein F5B19DRAFT_498322 [Rostrohypoxylon terebratum]